MCVCGNCVSIDLSPLKTATFPGEFGSTHSYTRVNRLQFFDAEFRASTGAASCTPPSQSSVSRAHIPGRTPHVAER
jgi:hypothetical protein